MTDFTTDEIKYEIVTSANEDISGLYEVIWALNSRYPDISEEDKINYIKEAIIDLLENNIINLYLKKWASNGEEMIDKLKALEIVMKNESWEVPSDKTNDEYYCFFTNGDRALVEQNRLYTKINGC